MNRIESLHINDWKVEITPSIQQYALETIEQGKILLLPDLPFNLSADEKQFLTASCARANKKNISYHPSKHKLRGTSYRGESSLKLQNLLHRYAHTSQNFIRRLLSFYQQHLEIGRTSFRPIEIKGRSTSMRQDDTRLHVDAFPATPNQGKRILRIFTNVNPHGEARVWRIGEPFADVVKRFLPQLTTYSPWQAKLLHKFKLTKSQRSAYDHYMLQLHDQMKANDHYQKTVDQIEFHFPAQSTWIVYTDLVSHAAMSGQFAFEQTFYLPINAMYHQEFAPLKILNKQLSARKELM